MKKSILTSLAIFVFLLAAGGEYANNLPEVKKNVIEETQDCNDEDLPDRQTLSLNIFNSVIQVSHLVFHNDLIFEFDLPEISKVNVKTIFNQPIHYGTYYKTLFRSIISPNAP